MKQVYDVVGIGNAIVDVIAQVDDGFLHKKNLRKASMTLISQEEAEDLYKAMPKGQEVSGGSVANSMAGIASLGGKGAYIGKVKNDTLGGVFQSEINKIGVAYATPLAESGSSTARCLILVTPDGQRTMHTYLGASVSIGEADIDAKLISHSKITYLEGYLFDTVSIRPALKLAAGLAHAAGNKVAFTLSDAWLVDRHREEMRRFVHDVVDILFANEIELLSFYQTSDLESALKRAHEDCDLAVITRSEKGSLIYDRKKIHEIPAHAASVVDTTGAGDLYAAGFLYGYAHGMDLPQCGRLGSICAAEIISHIGPRPLVNLRDFVSRHMALPNM